jgi:hypothetical protein
MHNEDLQNLLSRKILLEKSNDYDMGRTRERHNTSASNFSARYLLRKLYLEDTGINGWEMSK